MSERTKKHPPIIVEITIRPFQSTPDHERRKTEAVEHIVKFVYQNLEKKFPPRQKRLS